MLRARGLGVERVSMKSLLSVASIGAAALLAGAVVFACGSDGRQVFDDDGGGGGILPTGDASGTFDPTDAGNEAGKPVAAGYLLGKVTAPEGTVPISQALVYLTDRVPDPIPEKAYCDTCVKLTALEGYGYTKADGSFEVPAYKTGKQYIVVQKGQFRRVREINVLAGDQRVDVNVTRLPSKNDAAAGDTIPKIAMVVGGADRIDETMKKLGIEEFYRYGDTPPGFPIPLPSGPGIKTGKSANDLMGSAGELSANHIVLLPCASFGYTRNETSGGFTCGGPTSGQKTALKSYVDGGGKLYVTDFSYEAVRQTWPGFITWFDAGMRPLPDNTSGLGTACRGGAEDTPGVIGDQGLKDWMTAIGNGNVTLEASWSRIQKVTPQPGVDPTGKPITITPKVWMSSQVGGQTYPATVSFEQKCGRVLMSSYHCEGDSGSGLIAQEKALLYILLEVGVCVGDLPPPPPPR